MSRSKATVTVRTENSWSGARVPPLKWAGGKRWLIMSGSLPIPRAFERYIEPFLGGGALFFALRPRNSMISDQNPELVHFYRVLRESPLELYAKLKCHADDHSDTYYYKVRSQQPEGSVEKAARFLYLNRVCWNGLFRVNRQGQFNVPRGTKTKVLLPTDDFLGWAEALGGASICCGDFEESLARSQAGDFVFLDPPYTANHNLNGFRRYNEKIFSWKDQRRLAELAKGAVRRGAFVAITNADHVSVRELFGFLQYRKIGRSSLISGARHGRGETTEALFLSQNLEYNGGASGSRCSRLHM
jgi:DNA adenine methylase